MNLSQDQGKRSFHVSFSTPFSSHFASLGSDWQKEAVCKFVFFAVHFLILSLWSSSAFQYRVSHHKLQYYAVCSWLFKNLCTSQSYWYNIVAQLSDFGIERAYWEKVTHLSDTLVRLVSPTQVCHAFWKLGGSGSGNCGWMSNLHMGDFSERVPESVHRLGTQSLTLPSWDSFGTNISKF